MQQKAIIKTTKESDDTLDGGNMMHGDYGLGMGFGFGWLLWIVIIVGVIYLASRILRGPGKSGNGESALDILNKRYARGEINKDEYEKMKEDISKK